MHDGHISRVLYHGLLLLMMSVSGFIGEAAAQQRETLTNYATHDFQGRSVLFTTVSGQRLRITAYGMDIVRVQAARRDEEFFSDDRYEMVESHQWDGSLIVSDHDSLIAVETAGDHGIRVHIRKNPVRLSFFLHGKNSALLTEREGVCWEGESVKVLFRSDEAEHFTGLGHGYFGRSERIDLKGEEVGRNYGDAHQQQAPLVVPFYLSSKGYGIFLNSTFPNRFNFGKDGMYAFSLRGDARMDYFFIAGPGFSDILDRYTQLTGRPRFPPLAMLGLALSDKAHDHTSATPSDEGWWKQKITDHRNAGFPIDHVINDNRWRSGGGKRCGSYFEWDATRYPDPREYERWIAANGLVLTIDFNRCIAKESAGWSPSFNIPVADSIDFGESAPDFTRKEVRQWFWNLHWSKSLDPKLGYPGDALWIDEFDEMGKAPSAMILGNGRTWGEMKNYWFFLIAKALVEEGWDRTLAPEKRPFVWVRGMTAGAQRYATLWSGDIKPTYAEMKSQIRGMQLAGLSGFPFWGHDAGGFYDWEQKRGPDDSMYCKWSMAFGSFSPFWKPHGMGESRWPLDRSRGAQEAALRYCRLRYELIPYMYTYAHEASRTGIPIARAMILDHQTDSLAWTYDLQYMWGREFLVAPSCAGSDSVTLWLPDGHWYDFWSDSIWPGNRIVTFNTAGNKLALFVKAGAIIPTTIPSLSTAFMHKDQLTLQVYTGRDGMFELYEDDGISESYRTRGEFRTTRFTFNQSAMTLKIGPGAGVYARAPSTRTYRVDFHGLDGPLPFDVNGRQLTEQGSEREATEAGEGIVWNNEKKCLSVFLPTISTDDSISIKRVFRRDGK